MGESEKPAVLNVGPSKDEIKEEKTLKNPIGSRLWGKQVREKQQARQAEDQDVLRMTLDTLEDQMQKKLQHPQQHLTVSFETKALVDKMPLDLVVVLAQNTAQDGSLTVAVYDKKYENQGSYGGNFAAVFSKDRMGYSIRQYEDQAPYSPRKTKLARMLIEFVATEADKRDILKGPTPEEKNLEHIGQTLKELPEKRNLQEGYSGRLLNERNREIAEKWLPHRKERGREEIDHAAMEKKEYYVIPRSTVSGTATLENMLYENAPVETVDWGTAWQYNEKVRGVKGIQRILGEGGFRKSIILDANAEATLIIEKNKATGNVERALLIAGGGYVPQMTTEITLTDGVATEIKSERYGGSRYGFQADREGMAARAPGFDFTERTGDYKPQVNLDLVTRWLNVIADFSSGREQLMPEMEWPYNRVPSGHASRYEGLEWVLTETSIKILREKGCRSLDLREGEIPEELLQAALDRIHFFADLAATEPIPAMEQTDARTRLAQLQEGLRKIKTADFALNDLANLLVNEAYVDQYVALAEYQSGTRWKSEEIDKASSDWMTVAESVGKAEKEGLDKLSNDEISTVARAVSMLYTAYVFPELMLKGNENKKYGLASIIEDLYAQRDRIGHSENLTLYSLNNLREISVWGDHQEDIGDEIGTAMTNEELHRILILISQNKGLDLLTLTRGYELPVMQGEQNGDATGGWVIELSLNGPGDYHEGLYGTGESGEWSDESSENKMKHFYYDQGKGDFIAKDGDSLFTRLESPERYNQYSRTKSHILGRIQRLLSPTYGLKFF